MCYNPVHGRHDGVEQGPAGLLRQFEQALDDSTLVAKYRRLRQQLGS
jgi:hypothetical protein